MEKNKYKKERSSIMNYKGILTEEAAEQWRKEGAIHALINICQDVGGFMRSIRDMNINLDKDEKIFAVTAKAMHAEAKMDACFVGFIQDDKKWYPFDAVYKSSVVGNIDGILQQIADVADISAKELEWAFLLME